MDESVKVAMLYKDLGLGGVQRKMVDIANALHARGERNVCIFLSEKKGKFLTEIPRSTRVVDLNTSLRLPRVGVLPVKLARAFIQYKPRVLLAMMDTFGCSAVLARRLLGAAKPTVYISQDIQATGFFRERPLSAMRKTFVKELYPKAEMVFSVSHAVTEDLVRNYQIPKRKIMLLRNWVSEPKDMTWGKKTIDVIYCGRFTPEKDLSLLLDAFAILQKVRPNATLSLVGYGEEEDKIRKKIEALNIGNNVSLPGFTYNTSKLLRKSRVFVMTSYSEGIPLAMLEAMAAGVPVISRSFPGVDEIIRHKETGFIADSATSISEWMDYLLSHQRDANAVAKSAWKFVKKNHSAENLEKLVSILLSYS